MCAAVEETTTGRRPRRPKDPGRFVLIWLGALLAVVFVSILVISGILFPPTALIPHPPPVPLGTAFEMTNGRAENCTVQYVDLGLCVTAGNLIYIVQIAASTVTFGSVNFEIEVPGIGPLVTPHGGQFAIATSNLSWAAGTTIAGGDLMLMMSGWSRYAPGLSSSSELNATFMIVVDLGEPGPPPSSGFNLIAIGTGGYTGAVNYSLP